MGKWFIASSRVIALVLLVTFTFVTCSMPGGSEPENQIVITPGEGDPKYVYLDVEGKPSDTDTGRLGLYIENNKNAEGVVVFADKLGADDRVVVYNSNNDSTISIHFKPDAKFPYEIIMSRNGEVVRGWLSSYNDADSTYHLTFQQEADFSTMTYLVLNRSIFDLYQDDPALNAGDNARLGKITVALGLLGSLAAAFEKEDGDGVIHLQRGWFSSHFKNLVKAVVCAAAVVAAVIACVVCPVLTLALPTAAITIQTGVLAGAAAAGVIYSVGTAGVDDASDDTHEKPKPSVQALSAIIVQYLNGNRLFTNDEEFHIGKGGDVKLDLVCPGFVGQSITAANVYIYEPGRPSGSDAGTGDFFEYTVAKDNSSDRFQLVIKRKDRLGFVDDGKVAYGILFENNVNVNDVVSNVTFKLPDETVATSHNNMVVVRFCIDPACPHYVDY